MKFKNALICITTSFLLFSPIQALACSWYDLPCWWQEAQDVIDREAREAQEAVEREAREAQELADRLAREAQELADRLAREAQELADRLAREAQELADRLAREAQELADTLAREAQVLADRLLAYAFIIEHGITSNDTRDQILDKLVPKLNGVNIVKVLEDLRSVRESLSRNQSLERPLGDFTDTAAGKSAYAAIVEVMRIYPNSDQLEIESVRNEFPDISPQLTSTQNGWSNLLTLEHHEVPESRRLFLDLKTADGAVQAENDAFNNNGNASYTSLTALNDSDGFKYWPMYKPKYYAGTSSFVTGRVGAYAKVRGIDLSVDANVALPLSWGRGTVSGYSNIVEQLDKGYVNFSVGIEMGPGVSLVKQDSGAAAELHTELNINVKCKKVTGTPQCMITSFNWNFLNFDFSATVSLTKLKEIMKDFRGIAAGLTLIGIPVAADALYTLANELDTINSLTDAQNQAISTPKIAELGIFWGSNVVTWFASFLALTDAFPSSMNVGVVTELTPLQLIWVNDKASKGEFMLGWGENDNGSSGKGIDIVVSRALVMEHVDKVFKSTPFVDAPSDVHAKIRLGITQSMSSAIPMTTNGSRTLGGMDEIGNYPWVLFH